ncbi:MAG TPA: hypothetical protein VGM67_04030 [Gemmatimonadaceae bacterium]
MRSRFALTLIGLVVCTSAARAQSPVQTVFAACPTPTRAFSERQVQTPAHLISDSSASKTLAKSGQSSSVAAKHTSRPPASLMAARIAAAADGLNLVFGGATAEGGIIAI